MVKLAFYAMISVLAAAGLLLVQNSMMYALSKQYREVGYIAYGSFSKGSFLDFYNLVQQMAILVVPFGAFILIFWNFGKHATKTVAYEGDRIFICMLLIMLFALLAIRTAVIAVQGYALVFI